MTLTNQTIELQNQFNQITVSELGGQVLTWKTLSDDDNWIDILYTGSSPKRSGIPVLFPFANPLSENIFVPTGAHMGQHGFARHYVWKTVLKTTDTLILLFEYKDLPEQIQKDYPYPFQLFLHLDISHKNTLSYQLEIKNIGEKPMPIAPGIHPYFPIKHSQKNTLQVKSIGDFNPKNFPWEQKLDGTFFPFEGKAVLGFPTFSMIIEETTDQKDVQNLVVWSQSPTDPDHDFVCIEPFTRQTNAINDDPILVQVASSWKSSIRFVAF